MLDQMCLVNVRRLLFGTCSGGMYGIAAEANGGGSRVRLARWCQSCVRSRLSLLIKLRAMWICTISKIF